jgi:hypothetical protein
MSGSKRASGDNTSSQVRTQETMFRSAEDVELLDKLAALATAAHRGDVIKALDAANLVIAHGMFKCGTQRSSAANRDSVLRQCAGRFLGAVLAHPLCRPPLLQFSFAT